MPSLTGTEWFALLFLIASLVAGIAFSAHLWYNKPTNPTESNDDP